MSTNKQSPSSSPFSSRSRLASPTVSSNGMISVEAPLDDEHPLKAGEGRPRRHPLVATGPLSTGWNERITTLYDYFQESIKLYGERPCFGVRSVNAAGKAGPFEWSSYAEVGKRVRNLAAGLTMFKLAELSQLLAEQACFANRLVTVPLYDTLGDEAIEHICQQTEMAVAFVSLDKVKVLIRVKPKLSFLTQLVIMDGSGITDDLQREARKVGLNLVPQQEIEQMGSGANFSPRKPQPADLCTICYTSGTTGLPKGVMLTHGNVLSSASAVMMIADPSLRNGLELGCDDVHLSYLPLAHIYERVVSVALLALGASIGFYQGDVLKLMDDLAELKPTIFCSVPRLYNRIYDKIMATVQSKGWISRMLFHRALQAKLHHLKTSGDLTHWLWDRLVFGAVRARLGGRVKLMLSGAAPIAPEAIDFLRVAFSCQVFEGYGLTETCAASCISQPNDWVAGQVGAPFPSCEVKLVDIPSMRYTSADQPRPRGEICIRGPSVFIGYYKNAEKTAECLDAEGWFRTGDVGEWDERGRLRVIDRLKSIFKLAQGEYIAPEKIENAISRCPHVAQAFIEGNSLKSFLVAIVVPDKESVEAWAKQQGILYSSFEELCKLQPVQELINGEVQGLGNQGSKELKGFEVPRQLYLEPQLFSVENGLLTPSFKLKREEARRRFEMQIDHMYSQMSD